MTKKPCHWDASIERYCFSKVSEQEVTPEILQRAGAAAAFVCADLRMLRPPKSVWIRPVHPPAAAAALGGRALDVRLEESHRSAFTRLPEPVREGYTPCHPDLHEIWIRSDLTASPDLEYVVAHELRHVWQKLHLPEVFRCDCRAEGDAYPYGYEVLKRYLESQGRLTSAIRRDIDDKRAAAEKEFRAAWPDASFEIIAADPTGWTGGS